jgi:pyruvate dehydrogenase E1 component alpha subunit
VQAGEGRVAVTFFGDGGLNQGVLLESLNLATIWNLPVVFVCENNGYAVTMPATAATAGRPTERAAAYGMPAENVDGMDAELVLDAAGRAVGRARARGGPSFLECSTYRFVGHHTAERTMGLAYRSDAEIEQWRARDPLEVVGSRLPKEARQEIDARVELLLNEAVEFARASPAPAPEDALDYVYTSELRPRAGAA